MCNRLQSHSSNTCKYTHVLGIRSTTQGNYSGYRECSSQNASLFVLGSCPLEPRPRHGGTCILSRLRYRLWHRWFLRIHHKTRHALSAARKEAEDAQITRRSWEGPFGNHVSCTILGYISLMVHQQDQGEQGSAKTANRRAALTGGEPAYLV